MFNFSKNKVLTRYYRNGVIQIENEILRHIRKNGIVPSSSNLEKVKEILFLKDIFFSKWNIDFSNAIFQKGLTIYKRCLFRKSKKEILIYPDGSWIIYLIHELSHAKLSEKKVFHKHDYDFYLMNYIILNLFKKDILTKF